jgi:SulP family sulfate permease
MAYLILGRLGDEDPQAVMATVITSYALSSVLTGLIFLLLGALRLGNLVSFFPRSILLGCIGGVGVFLFLTGIEVSAGVDSSLGWGIDTVERLFFPTTLMLWIIPLLLAISLMVVRKYFSHPVVMPAFFIMVVAVFYIVITALPNVDLEKLRATGWVFNAPRAGVPFYNFYTYYRFGKIHWDVLLDTVPTMFALSFFGIIHVPINVPALGIAVQQDDININRELFGHGVSNALSGMLGSIQNYLVFANSRLFIQNGGNSRWAGVLLALGTTGIWIAGPAMIGYIPIMIVGTLIFMLGIEMVQEALWDTFGKIQLLEYLMVLAITVVMGFYDFVVGIVLGIVLACFNFVVQTSRVSAIRAVWSGTIAESTVRRHPLHRRFLHAVGGQIKVTKLSGYLFFGSIVAVEKRIREMIDEEAFSRQPIRYLILDFTHVTGLDFSAAEAFVRMDRVLRSKQVELLISGISLDGEVGQSLIMVGLLEGHHHIHEDDDHEPDNQDHPPRIFEDLNQALEACENELLLAFKQRTEQHLAKQLEHQSTTAPTSSMVIPQFPFTHLSAPEAVLSASPRRDQVAQAATTALESHVGDLGGGAETSKWASFAQPLPLILQAFKDVTEKDYDFWHRATGYFARREIPAGSVLYTRGDVPDGLYLLETGVLRAEYELESGRFAENIVAGTTLGEMTFFSLKDHKLRRNATRATVIAETDSVAWVLTTEKWEELERDWKEGAAELLRVGIGLLGERMRGITS